MEWQPIETAPEWQRVIVFQREAPKTKSNKTGVFTATFVGHGQWALTHDGRLDLKGDYLVPQPTHWMPLPQPPQTTQQQEMTQ